MVILPGAVGLVIASLQSTTPVTAPDNLVALAIEASATTLVASSRSGCGLSWPESTYVRRFSDAPPIAELDGAESLEGLLDAVVAETV